MTAWEEAIEASSFAFIEGLERRGFRADDSTLTGTFGEGADAVRIEIALPDDFPFAPPVVSPPNDFPRSWHRERSGAMCLYPADGRENLPWLVVDEFVALVERWIAESRAGGPTTSRILTSNATSSRSTSSSSSTETSTSSTTNSCSFATSRTSPA